jgi:hypothetical protein
MHLVGFYYKNISRCTFLWMSNSANSFRPNCRYMLQTLRQMMEVKLQVMSALCMTKSYRGIEEIFPIVCNFGTTWKLVVSITDGPPQRIWSCRVPQPVWTLGGRRKCDFFNAHKYNPPRADFHQKRTLATFGKHELIVVLRPYVKWGTQWADFYKTPDGSVQFYGHLLSLIFPNWF